ncbi:MAG TPA: DUF433 domain-containing protein [Pirellulales bacterium]|nr:DUF433 domain-containing protein [Pirellulales bacterium]
MSVIPVISEHIEVTAEVCGGKPRIAGRRIRVQDVVVWHEEMGMTPAEIVSKYPTISLGDVHAALAYYYDHVAEIRQQMADEASFVAGLRATASSKLTQIQAERRTQGMTNDAGADSVPPG